MTFPDNGTITRYSAASLFICALLALGLHTYASRLPGPGERPQIHDAPLQTPTTQPPFDRHVKNHTYHVRPLFDYHLSGMVVSLSDAMGWLNISHKDWGDYLNTNDFCVVWGANAETLKLSDFKFTHGDFTCYYYTTSREAFTQFHPNEFSNNHVLPDTPEIAKQFADVHIGDQIQFDGMLVGYSIDGGSFERTSSTTREDTGEHACEVVYVTGFQFLSRWNLKFYRLAKCLSWIAIASAILLAISMFVLPFVRTEKIAHFDDETPTRPSRFGRKF